MYSRRSLANNRFSRQPPPSAATRGKRKTIYNPFKFGVVINRPEIRYNVVCDKFSYMQVLFGVPKYELMELLTKTIQIIRNELMTPYDDKHFSIVCKYNGNSEILHPKTPYNFTTTVPDKLNHHDDNFTFVLILVYLEDISCCPNPAIVCAVAALNVINYGEADEFEIIQQFCKLTHGDVREKFYYPRSSVDNRRVVDPCLICYINPATAVMRCWHSVLCRRCSLNFKPCLLCSAVHGLDYIEFPSGSDGEDED